MSHRNYEDDKHLIQHDVEAAELLEGGEEGQVHSWQHPLQLGQLPQTFP